MATKYIPVSQAFKPQSLSYVVPGPGGAPPTLVTVYTGTIAVEFGVGSSLTKVDIEYPILNREGALQPFDTKDQFGSAVAAVSLASISGYKNEFICAVDVAAADLREVSFAPSQPPQKVLAAVLTATVAGRQSETYRLAYHVTVLSRTGKDLPSPRKIDAAVWNGTYSKIGPILVPGDPAP